MTKEKPAKAKPAHTDGRNERTLSIIATIILYAGLAGGIVLILLAVMDFINYEGNAVTYLLSGLSLVCLSVISATSLRVKCNISNNLRELNQKINNN